MSCDDSAVVMGVLVEWSVPVGESTEACFGEVVRMGLTECTSWLSVCISSAFDDSHLYASVSADEWLSGSWPSHAWALVWAAVVLEFVDV